VTRILQDGPSLVNGIIEIPLTGQPLIGNPDQHGDHNSRLCLPHFITGTENNLLATACQSLLDHRTGKYNPLVLYGTKAVGKTHLARGMASLWIKRYLNRRVIYTTALDFVRQLADAVETQAVDDLRTRFRKLRLLVIEDIDRLGGKQMAQVEVVYTLDTLIGAGQQVMVTASDTPSLLPGIMPQLLSRLAGGLTVRVSPPSSATGAAILHRLAELRELSLSKPVARVLAEGLNANVPELDRVLGRLAVKARLQGGKITMEAARRHLTGGDSTLPGLRDIASATARYFSLKLSDLRSPSRRRVVVNARGVAMYLARALAGQSLEHIGQYFSGRDHSTVMHSCRKTESLLKTDPDIREAVKELRQKWQVV